MASGGNDFSTRMSAEDYKLMYKIALKHFKERKVEISDAIKTIFPFLEILRDRGFITNEKYTDYKKACDNMSPVQKVVYDVLDNMEEKHHFPLLEILFSKVVLKKYPDLNSICEGFRDVMLKKICQQASVGEGSTENPNTQLSLQQGIGEKPYPSLTWLFPDLLNNEGIAPPILSEYLSETEEINAMDTSTISDNNALENQQADEQRAQESELAEIKSEDSSMFDDGDDPTEATTLALTSEPGSVDLENNPALEKTKKKRRTKLQPGEPVNYQAEILPVTCREMTGLLIKRKLERGAIRKCIRIEDGTWLNPREFEIRGGYTNANNWKTNVICGGNTLKRLMELGYLHPLPKTIERKKKEENSDKCWICQDEGKLFHCVDCQKFFHGDCHLPPVENKRNAWNCTFCIIQKLSSHQPCTESEVLVKLMGPEEKLKCEYLLLKVYENLEGTVFPNIPNEHYVREASQYLGKLRMLDKIKKKLIKENFRQVDMFMRSMDNFFRDTRRNNLFLIKEEFTKNFREVFAIQETK